MLQTLATVNRINTLLSNLTSQASQYRQQTLADTQNLTSASFRDLSNNQLANINKSLESSGSSASALGALLSQNATAAVAGQVAKIRVQALQAARQSNITLQNSALDSLIKELQNQTTMRGQDIQSVLGQGQIYATLQGQATQAGISHENNLARLQLQQLANAQSGQNTLTASNTAIDVANINASSQAANKKVVSSPFGVPVNLKGLSSTVGNNKTTNILDFTKTGTLPSGVSSSIDPTTGNVIFTNPSQG